jgi:hypothetical protein
MNYDEAKKLADLWTKNHDPDLDGWRSVIAVLLERVESLEATNASLFSLMKKIQLENDKLSLDLGIKNEDFSKGDQNGWVPRSTT